MVSIIFDLDNTLYPEETYVESGFEEVSKFLSEKYDLNKEELFLKLKDIFKKKGRGFIFDILLKDLDIYSKKNLLTLVYVYRYHVPNIKLYDDVLDLINQLKKENFKLGIITDGRSFVQKRKIEALEIAKYFNVIIYTDVLGEENWKPSTTPYKIALDLLDSKGDNTFYIGDDPYKDFLGAKKLGIKTIQIDRNLNLSYWAEKGYEEVRPDYKINNLNEILNIIK
ncbi:MAG: HAD-IA family hydrolase [Methanobrevibacter sp.]|jgi:putative hydrolase of the HAD superfamily|nr:HAD-IA family hydrolase [Candidatus Methanovirga aequatorialis]